MHPDPLSDSHCAQLSGLVAERMGLHFPPARWSDLQRGLAGAAEEFGFKNIADCAHWLASAPLAQAQVDVLAAHLTIGETYFFRDAKAFEALATSVLPGITAARRGREPRLRLWSAGCCTGEEAYSFAILLHQILPDLADWNVTILATDINARFLQRAALGSYGEWSFRTAPANFKERYFDRSADGRYVVKPEIKAMVTFTYLNLAEDVYPSLANDTNAMDVIFCRNVLIYFTPERARLVIGKLHHALLEGGCLAVSPSEAWRDHFPQFALLNFPGAILYQKCGTRDRSPPTEPSTTLPESAEFFSSPFAGSQMEPPASLPEQPPELARAPELTGPAPFDAAASCYAEGHYAEAIDLLLPLVTGKRAESPVFSLLARALANTGRLAEALTWCDRWIATHKLDSAGHYLRAVILLEQGDRAEARESLQRAVYLHPDFVLAHFALGNLGRSSGQPREAARHFRNALQLLSRQPAGDPLPDADGLTVGRLTATIHALTGLGANRSIKTAP